MSLYIGNLSSRIRRDELERVFQRFGRCNVRLKDGYGFVVYEFPPNAEKALRALQKRYICGEPLTLTWSNKQPRPFKRLARVTGSYEPQHDRHSVKGEDNVKGKLGSNDQDYQINVKQSDGVSREHHEEGFLEDDAKDNQENHGYRKEFSDERGRFEPDLVENDRWGDQFHDQPNKNGVENEIEFERYEPYQGYHRKHDGIHQLVHHGSFPDLQSPPKDIRGDHVDGNLKTSDVKLQVTCYRCGGSGHKMRSCPQENPSFRKSTRFGSRHDDDIHRRGRGETDIGRFGSRSWERHQSRKDVVAKRRLKNDVKSSSLGKQQRPISTGSSPVRKETDNSWKSKRSRKEIGSSERHETKKRRSFLSPHHSEYTASQSYSASQSTEHVKRSRPHSRSKSVSSRAHSSSSKSKSSSTSHYSRSKRSKSRARSSSHTSLSVSLGQPLPSSSNKAQPNLKGSSDNATTPESKALLIELEQSLEGDSGLGDNTLENRMVAQNNKYGVPPSKAEIEMKNDQPLKKDNEDHPMASGSLHEVTNLSKIAAEEKGAIESPKSLAEIVCQNSDELMIEHVPVLMKNPDSGPLVSSCSGVSKSISSEELSMVLKHYYGLNLQSENERHLPADVYFGSARLWPWEVIYYRRLKKGPISIENYARRVDQNREFGIVDKYIRSSSGWGELDPENP